MFGNLQWSDLSAAALPLELHGTRKQIRQRIRDHCPALPGVYGMLNNDGHIVYVGMSKRLPHRLQSYFSATGTRKKETRIRRRAAALLWQPLPHELIARLRERELIRSFRPDFNIQGHPVRMKVGYIVVVDQLAETLRLVTEIPKHHLGIWGPLPHNGLSQSAVEQLNLHFGLRDCPKQTPIQFAGEETEPPPTVAPVTCLRVEMKTCLSPCIAACSRQQYAAALKRAQSFLSGRSQQVLQEIDQQMREAAQERQFEKAGKLRDRSRAFSYIFDHLRRFHDWSSKANFIYRVQSAIDQRKLWMVVVRGIIADIVPQPETEEARKRVANLIVHAQNSLCGQSPERTLSKTGDFEAARILFRWFRKHPQEKLNQLSLKKGLKFCEDGLKKAS